MHFSQRFFQVSKWCWLGVAIFSLQGCITTAHLLSAATTSPGNKTCWFYMDFLASPSSSDTAQVAISGGFMEPGKELQSQVKREMWPDKSRTVWPKTGKYYYGQDKPCVRNSALGVSVISESRKWYASIPIEELPSQPVFGSFYLTIDGNKVRLSLAENIGNTKYSAASMSMGWATEPLRTITEVEFLELPP